MISVDILTTAASSLNCSHHSYGIRSEYIMMTYKIPREYLGVLLITVSPVFLVLSYVL